tara:strand:+ start:7126 stop:7602 length:477 start_codon:yes stop_codon:yes gene_type:complete
MSIKYSGILATDEVTSAGDDDIIVLAIVDGTSATGYTTKAIKKSNLIVEPLKAFHTLTEFGPALRYQWDYDLGYNAQITMTSDRLMDEPTNVEDGDYGTLVITQDSTGGWTLGLPASFKVVNGGGGAITLSTAPNSVDSISWVKKGSDFLVTLGLNFS